MPDRRSVLQGFAAMASAGLALPARAARRTSMTAWDFDFVSIDGDPMPLRQWQGKPVLVVNTASFCGFTYQYKGLEALYRAYKDRGFVLLGVPSNDFGAQEPGKEAEIKTFCATYDVSFPLSRKEDVVGPKAHPFYRWIAEELGPSAVPRWNFHKYLVDRGGLIAGAWASPVEPNSKEITAALDTALAQA